MNEALVQLITEKVIQVLNSEQPSSKKVVKVGVSARHVHLSKEHLEVLFGKGYELSVKKYLMGDQFASEELVTIVGPKLRSIEKVRILGPLRDETQIEVSLTDGFKLGIKAPIRESGKLENTPGIKIIGPKGSVETSKGTIAALRHIHMDKETAKKLELNDKDIVDVEIKGKRKGILGNVLIRVSDKYVLEMHIDTDEANALGIKNGSFVEII